MVITEDFFALFLEIVRPWNIFYVDLHCPLICGRCSGRKLTTATPVHNAFLILKWNLPYSPHNLSVELFRGCWLTNIFFVWLKVCGHIMKRYRVSSGCEFLLNDYNSMAISFVTTINLWQRKRYT